LLKPLNWNQTKSVVELGAGTGVVTEQIVRRVNPSCQIFIFEIDSKLRQYLKNQFPGYIHCSDARYLKRELVVKGMKKVDCVISSLPFANFSKDDRLKILDEIQQVLSSNGVFVAYQYSLQMLPILKEYFEQVEVHFVLINLPPAFVYVCSK
jgi:phospholipid N-methyltransferase